MTFDNTFIDQIKADLKNNNVPVIITPLDDNTDALTSKLRQQPDTDVFVVSCAKLHNKKFLTNPAGLTNFGPDIDRSAMYPNPAYLPAITVKTAIECATDDPNKQYILVLTGLNRNNPENGEEIADAAIEVALTRTFDSKPVPANLGIILAGHGALIKFSKLSADETERIIIYKDLKRTTFFKS